MPDADRSGTAGPSTGRLGRSGLVLAAGGLGCLLLTALLGPSVMEAPLPGRPGRPPYSLLTHPTPQSVIGLTAAGILLSCAGLALCLHAVRRGWAPRTRLLLLAGGLATAAFAIMPPVGSGDHLNYAAYGRMVVTGHDPYATTARDLPADPVARAVQDWRATPTVYGPVATAQQTFASLVGGTSMRLTVFVMSLTNALAFLVTGLLLFRAARGDPRRELRTALLWTANPILIFELVGGAHNDVLAIAFAIAGLVAFGLPDPLRGRPWRGRSVVSCLVAGVLIGLGAATKINVAIVGGGPALLLVHDWWRDRDASRAARMTCARLAALFGATGAVTIVAYVLAGPHSIDQLDRASKAVSLATPWHFLAGPSGGLLATVPRSIVQAGSLLLAVALAVLLVRTLPRTPPGSATVGRSGLPAMAGRSAEEAYRFAAALALAWLFAAPYALPWYDALGWATLALVGWSGFDRLLLARTTVLALAYLPARDSRTAGLPHDLGWLVTVVRSQLTPWALALALTALVVTATRRAHRSPAPGCSPRAPAGSPP